MDAKLSHDLEHIEAVLERTLDHALDALGRIEDRPAALAPPPATPSPLPERGVGFDAALDDFAARWAPGFSGSAGARYLGFVTGGATPAAIAGDWLTSIYDQNPTAGIDSTAPDLERETVARLRELFGLSDAQQGVLVSGATMSNLVGLAIGREWLGERCDPPVDVAEDGVGKLPTIDVLSGAPHSSIYKALSVLGIGRRAVRKIPTLKDREAVDVAALEAALRRLDGKPAIVVANAGTVNTVDYDTLPAIAALKSRYPFWLHVDAAFGAFAALSPEHASLTHGLDDADSICIDLHKWLNVPYDAAVQFSRRRDLQVRVFQNSAAYLGVPADNPDFVHLTPENSRRLRALSTWFALAAYGRDGHAEIVRRNIALARRLGRLIDEQPGLTLLAPTRLNVVCFTLAEQPDEARVNAHMRAVRDLGDAFITTTVYAGTWGLRAAFSNWRTDEGDVDRVFRSLVRALG
ncbi:pyridoxal phosphate-dependent decarboxylase family protein [Burkholderia oklahomensis]|uniref:Beta-eliminating lyase family protein n=1 Tax=Burkholderia oklahomensis TaxID=342113 RepID=A0AAI8FR04_9BURK|nr:pyridoxal-dependent decarboxylase [Burkholderia oklahomensis]AIO69515.1 beta-eliminating lyase family protein [Burkholderia oklahomensis]AOI39952.1 amino acid decarboxylase [Burkholderia oklahomensis EO147]KUY62114.1 amino acid decarboxylase [Burkholderia oklahomensis EO147]QPS39683.1 aspartate aminotransferase family protein [Burkholderia oklahomensis]